jgi:Predicted integral membrane protein (DUF2269)
VTITTLVVVAHALLGVLFIAGLIGRWIVLGLSQRATDLPSMKTLAAAAGPFERLVIVVPSFVLLFGVAAAYLQGRSVLGPLTGGSVDWLFVSLLLFISPLPLVPLVFLPRGRIFEAAMASAEANGGITPELQSAWRDPVVRAAHVYELGSVTLVLILMLTKPF